MRVLIVEDDRLLANGLTETLRRSGYVADAVGSAEAADAALKVTDVDLIVLDIGLPGLDGFSWLRKLRGRGGQQSVLVLTARDALADRVLGLNVGADDYLAKPFATEELVARVRARIARARPGAQARGGRGQAAGSVAARVRDPRIPVLQSRRHRRQGQDRRRGRLLGRAHLAQRDRGAHVASPGEARARRRRHTHHPRPWIPGRGAGCCEALNAPSSPGCCRRW